MMEEPKAVTVVLVVLVATVLVEEAEGPREEGKAAPVPVPREDGKAEIVLEEAEEVKGTLLAVKEAEEGKAAVGPELAAKEEEEVLEVTGGR